MQHHSKRLIALVLLSAVPLSGCATSSQFDSEPAANEGAAKVEHVGGVDQVVLSARAAARLGIETARVTRAPAGGARRASRTVIPYAAVLYDESGQAFTFTSPSRLTYVQRPITVAYVKGGRAVLTHGPTPGTRVVTVGSAELLGTVHGVEED